MKSSIDTYNTVLDAVLSHAERFPDACALIDGEGSATYRELGRTVSLAARYLCRMGIGREDRVMISAVPFARYVVAYLALHYVGAVVIPVAKDAVPDSIDWIAKTFTVKAAFLENTQVEAGKGIYSLSELASEKEAIYSEIPDMVKTNPETLSDILLTTGTTGESKGVMLTNKNIKAAVFNVLNGQNMAQDDRVLIPVPVNHSFGIRVLRAVLYKGATVILANGFNSIKQIYHFIHQYQCTGMCCVPAAISILYQQTKNAIHKLLGPLKYIEFCTAPLPLDIKRRLLSDLPDTRIINSYGSTEAAGVIYINYSTYPDKLNSIGKPNPGVDAQIVDNENRIMTSDKEHFGRLALSGDVIMNGYWNDVDLTDKTIVNDMLLTNDMAYIEDGYVYLLGRRDDIINIGGRKVSPLEIENTLMAFQKIKECCCISVPDAILGNVPVAFVTLADKSTYSESELYRFLNEHLERYAVPKKIILLEEIPKNYMGKFERLKLIEIWQRNQ